MDILQSQQPFQRTCQDKGYSSLTAGKELIHAGSFRDQRVLHNFTSRRKCADAAFANGEATVKGAMTGDSIDGLDKTIGRAQDGGSLTSFMAKHTGESRSTGRPVSYYHTFFDAKYEMTITPDTVAYLFKRGVDDTIKMLVSESFILKGDSNGNSGMLIATKGTYHQLSKMGRTFAPNATFFDVGADVEIKQICSAATVACNQTRQ